MYGCSIDAVREIVPQRRATRIPGAPMALRSPPPAALARSLAAVAQAPDLATHPTPLDAFGFYDLDDEPDGHRAGGGRR